MGVKLPYFFQPNEEQAFLKACEERQRDYAIWKMLFDSGMRISELVGDKRTGYRGLYVEDINLNSPDGKTYEVRVLGKGKKERLVLVSKQAVDGVRTSAVTHI
jgi:site-specific recombinase XerD